MPQGVSSSLVKVPIHPHTMLAASMRFIHALKKRGNYCHLPLSARPNRHKCKYRQKREVSKMLLRSNRMSFENSPVYRSASSSSGSGICAASCISFWYCSRRAWSTVAVGGARAGAATNSYRFVSYEPSKN
jgi:hypothetical protein